MRRSITEEEYFCLYGLNRRGARDTGVSERLRFRDGILDLGEIA